MGLLNRWSTGGAAVAAAGFAIWALSPEVDARSSVPSTPASMLATAPVDPGIDRSEAPGPSIRFVGVERPSQAGSGIPREFYFSRVAYSGYGRGFYGRGRSWAVDFPKADRQFLIVLERLVNLDVYPNEHPVVLDDPGIRRFPFLYALEVGGMALSQEEVDGLRSYLLAGGFLVIDDFWGTWEWENFENEIRRVLPEFPIVELGLDHPLFSSFYDIDEIRQVPGVGRGRRGGPTHEGDGYTPHVRGIFDDKGRLMVVINWNTDLGDAWEWAEDPYYPLEYSTYAYEVGVNMIIYAMSH